MKKSSFFVALCLFLCGTALSQAIEQRHICGTTVEDQAEVWPRLHDNIITARMSPAHERGAVQYVPVHFHLTKNSAGTGRVAYNQVLDALCGLNEFYAPHDIQFYFSPHPSDGELWNEGISNDGVHNDQSNSFSMQLQKHNNAVNIYVAQAAVSGNAGPGITLAYYSPSFDWIVTRKAEMNRISNTLTHEVGHFFSLMHTFWGYEGNPFDPSDPTWPVAPSTPPNPFFSGHQTEKMDGSNCNGALANSFGGDGFCDTPPDYNFGLIAGSCSNYNGGAQDPNGILVDPMENNHMSYFSNCADYMFTPNQMTAFRADLNSSARNFLDNTFQPVATEITTPANLITKPANNSQVPFFNHVEVEWQAVQGATHYIVDIDFVPNFISPNAKSLIVEGNTLVLSDLGTNRTYHLRIRPFNYAVTCAASEQIKFLTNDTPLSSNTVISAINTWNLQPNPTSGNDISFLTLDANETFDANIRIFDLAGKEVANYAGQRFNTGKNTVELQTSELNNGIYFVKIENGQALSTKKLVVVR